jgi:hypothetical protein
MATEVQAMWDRLPALDAREAALKIESCGCAYPAVDDDGEVKTVVSNLARLGEIKIELAAITSKRAKIEDKLLQLKALLGDNGPHCIPVPGGEYEYAGRLRADFALRFHNKIVMANRQPLLPSEAMETEAYKSLCAEILPKLAEVAARDKEARELSAAAYAILREP